MVESYHRTILDVLGSNVVPSVRALHLSIGTKGLSLILKNEDIVLVFVRIESDLLLFASRGIHVSMRVKVATLGVQVTKAHTRTENDICGNILHSFGV
jgi:hypothetical protein